MKGFTLGLALKQRRKATQKSPIDFQRRHLQDFVRYFKELVELLDSFLCFQMWSQPCAHVVFDTDPAPRGRTDPAQAEEMSQAMIRSDVKPFLGFHSITSFHITPSYYQPLKEV